MILPADRKNRNLPFPMRGICILALIFLVGALCSPASATRDVKVALTDLKPNLYTDEQGKPAGFFVDLITDLAAQEDWNIIWVPGSLSESWDRLSTGEIDLLPGVADTPERENSIDFSHESALSAWSQVYARPGSGINTILDLKGKRIAMVRGAQSGIAFQDYAQKFGVNATYIEKNTPADVFSATASGEADALVVYNTAGQADAVTYGLAATPVMFNPTQFGFAVQKGENGDLLTAIDRYIAKGKNDPSSPYSQSMQRWYGIKASPIVPPVLVEGLVTVALVAILFFGVSFFLRQQVRRKTAELSRQNEELQKEIASRKQAETEIIQKTGELRVAYEQLTAAEGELRTNYDELRRSQEALQQATKKLNLLNAITFQDIQNALFSLSGYLQLERTAPTEEQPREYRDKEIGILKTITETLKLASQYQNLGLKSPTWQDVRQTFLFGISHTDLSRIERKIEIGNLEIFADPLLEQVFFTLAENVVLHGKSATEIALRFRETENGLILVFEDNGAGVPADMKENIFNRRYEEKKGMGLFLAREILSITNITIVENGEPGKGARFEISVPKEAYRFVGDQ